MPRVGLRVLIFLSSWSRRDAARSAMILHGIGTHLGFEHGKMASESYHAMNGHFIKKDDFLFS